MPPRGKRGGGKKGTPRAKTSAPQTRAPSQAQTEAETVEVSNVPETEVPTGALEDKAVPDPEVLPTVVDVATTVPEEDVGLENKERENANAELKDYVSLETIHSKTEDTEEETVVTVETVEVKEVTTTQLAEGPASEPSAVEDHEEPWKEMGDAKDGEKGSFAEPPAEKYEDDLEKRRAIAVGAEVVTSGFVNENNNREDVEAPEENLDGVESQSNGPVNEEDDDLEDPEEIIEELEEEDNEAVPMDQEEAIKDEREEEDIEGAPVDQEEGGNEELGDDERPTEVKDTGGEIKGAGPTEGGDIGDQDDESGSDEEENDENGEEEEDPSVYMHAPLSDRKKQKEFEIFVGGLDKEAVEDDLIKVFGEFGEIQAARIVKHPTTHKSKGFAFIRYATIDQAKKALSELKDGVEVRGKRVGISASQDNDTLYMGNICKTWTKDQLLETLKSYAIEQIEEIYLPEDPKSEGKNKGFALLEFSTHSDAMAAFQRLRKPDAIFGCDRSARVSFAQSSMHPSEEALSQVKTVYVEGLPSSWDEEKVKDHCKQYGEIEKVQLSKNFATSRRKDFGFILFTSHESAVACVEGINNTQIGEEENKVKANLAKPQNKGRLAKQGARGGFKVQKDGEHTEEAGRSMKAKRHAKSKGSGGKGKGPSKFRSGRGGPPLRPHHRPSDDHRGGRILDHKRKEPHFGAGKHGVRGGPPDHNTRPPKKARGKDFDTRRNYRFGKPKGNYPSRLAPYKDPYAYGGPVSGYQGRGYGAPSGSKRHYSDMEPHAGYIGPPTKQVHQDSYGYGHRSSGGYNSHATSGAGYRGSAPQPSYGAEPSNYGGYEAGYSYHATGGAYPPAHAAYPPAAPGYPSPGAAYPHSNAPYPPSGAHPPSGGAYPPRRPYY